MKTELELTVYAELGDFFDRYARSFLHSKEHQALALRIALALVRLEGAEE